MEDTLEDVEVDPDDLTLLDDSTVLVDVEEAKKIVGRRRLALAVTIICCFLGTIGALMLFSRPDFHENADKFARSIITPVTEWLNTMPWALIVFFGAALVIVLGFIALKPLDRLTRRIPSGEFLLEHVGLSFEGRKGILRFLPGIVTTLYFAVGAFLRFLDPETDFNPESYNPLSQQYGLGEWANWLFMVLVVFTLLLVIAEGIVNGGPLGIIVHIPLIVLANICFAAFGVRVVAAAIQLIQIAIFLIAVPVILVIGFLCFWKKK